VPPSCRFPASPFLLIPPLLLFLLGTAARLLTACSSGSTATTTNRCCTATTASPTTTATTPTTTAATAAATATTAAAAATATTSWHLVNAGDWWRLNLQPALVERRVFDGEADVLELRRRTGGQKLGEESKSGRRSGIEARTVDGAVVGCALHAHAATAAAMTTTKTKTKSATKSGKQKYPQTCTTVRFTDQLPPRVNTGLEFASRCARRFVDKVHADAARPVQTKETTASRESKETRVTEVVVVVVVVWWWWWSWW
jgi:hypothetical protein